MATAAAPVHPLALLAAAPSKDALATFFNACFRHRHSPASAATSRHITGLGLDPEASAQVTAAGIDLIKTVLYSSADITSAEQIAAVLPADLDARLKALIAMLVFTGLPMWREASIASRVGLPALVESKWSVDVVDATSDLSKAATPAVQLQLAVRGQATRVGEMPPVETVAVELNHASLGALVDGMRRIRDQLAGMS